MIDGIVLSSIVHELNTTLTGGRVDKITQPEKDELIIHIRAGGKKQRLLMTASASMPRVHLTYENKLNPASPPSYCMLLRKYIGNARIIGITQLGLERIVKISLEQLNELGDLCTYNLIIEVMGKHSNIILCDQNNLVLDSIKRIGANTSRVRQVFPGQTYTTPPDQDKKNILDLPSEDDVLTLLKNQRTDLYKALYQAFTGLSPFIANNICLAADVDGNGHIEGMTNEEFILIYQQLKILQQRLLDHDDQPVLIRLENGEISDYHSLLLTDTLPGHQLEAFDSISELINYFYEARSVQVRMKQKTQDLRRIVQVSLERCYKKLDIQERQLEDTKNMDTFKIKGELILANQYQIKPGIKEIDLFNYYTNKMVTIHLDPTKTAIQNSNKAFDKYAKKKRTKEAVTKQVKNTRDELKYLESVKYTLDSILHEDDIEEIRHELMSTGYIKFRHSKRKRSKSKPYHYLSSDGFHMYVGKNNYQNEELSMKFANGSDWWFHTKEVPGSHVIVKCEGDELPDRAFEEAAALAAYYSKARLSTKVTVDYTQKKHLKKPAGSPPGYVIYHTNYSLFIDPDISALTLVE